MTEHCFCEDYEPPEFYHLDTRRARKLHRCTECRRAIQPGETHERVRAKWDGLSIENLRACCRCLALRACVTAHIPCFCWSHHRLLDDAREAAASISVHALGSGLLFEIGRLAVAIKRAPRPKDVP